MPIGGRSRIRVERAEAGKSNGCEFAKVDFLLFEEVNYLSQGFFWSGGLKARFSLDVIGACANSADKFGAAAFDAAIERIELFFIFFLSDIGNVNLRVLKCYFTLV